MISDTVLSYSEVKISKIRAYLYPLVQNLFSIDKLLSKNTVNQRIKAYRNRNKSKNCALAMIKTTCLRNFFYIIRNETKIEKERYVLKIQKTA